MRIRNVCSTHVSKLWFAKMSMPKQVSISKDPTMFLLKSKSWCFFPSYIAVSCFTKGVCSGCVPECWTAPANTRSMSISSAAVSAVALSLLYAFSNFDRSFLQTARWYVLRARLAQNWEQNRVEQQSRVAWFAVRTSQQHEHRFSGLSTADAAVWSTRSILFNPRSLAATTPKTSENLSERSATGGAASIG